MDLNYPSGYGAENDSTVESTLAEVRAVIAQLEDELKSKGTRLSGRIIHVTHYLPIVTTLKSKSSESGEPIAPISPPKTPIKDIISLEQEKANKAREYTLFLLPFTFGAGHRIFWGLFPMW